MGNCFRLLILALTWLVVRNSQRRRVFNGDGIDLRQEKYADNPGQVIDSRSATNGYVMNE